MSFPATPGEAWAADEVRRSRPSREVPGILDELHADCIAAVMEEAPRVRVVRGYGGELPARPRSGLRQVQ